MNSESFFSNRRVVFLLTSLCCLLWGSSYPAIKNGYQLAIGGALLTAVGMLCGGALNGFTLKSTALLCYLILLSSASLALWTIPLKYNRVGMVAVFNFMVPIFGALLSAIFLGEIILK